MLLGQVRVPEGSLRSVQALNTRPLIFQRARGFFLPMAPAPRYSLVIPVFNEEAVFPLLTERVKALLARLDAPAEVVLVDDGSRDRSWSLMTALAESDPRFRVVQLARNFGHQLAITAGMDLAEGEAIIVMDADLQDPPEVVLDLIARWKEGYEVVYAQREEREDETWFKKATAAAYYRIMRRLTEIDLPVDVGDFRLVDRKALDAFRQLREDHRFVRGMFSWIGFRQIGVKYRRSGRAAGETKYPLRKMIRLAVDGILSFSNAPLRAVLRLGLGVSAISFLLGLYVLFSKLAEDRLVPGWASLAILVSFIGGLQLFVLGVIGEYIARIYTEVKRRPLYLVRDVRGGPQASAPFRSPERTFWAAGTASIAR